MSRHHHAHVQEEIDPRAMLSAAATTWTGTPTTLNQYQKAELAQTTNGSLVFGYINNSTSNNLGQLMLTSGGGSVPLSAPAGMNVPQMYVHNWQANNLTATNISAAATTPIWIAAIGPGLPGVTPANLPSDGTSVTLKVWASAQGTTDANNNILKLSTQDDTLAVFAIIGGPQDANGNNAYVIALNDPNGDSGPSLAAPPSGYYATTAGNAYSFTCNWPGATVFVANLSPSTSAVNTVQLISF